MNEREQLLSDETMQNILARSTARARNNVYQGYRKRAQKLGCEEEFTASYEAAKADYDRAEKIAKQQAITLASQTTYLSLKGFPSYLEIPARYHMDYDGIRHFDDKALEYISVFPHPIIIAARYQNMDTGLERVEVRFFDCGEVRSFLCPASTVSSTKDILSLRDRGIRVTSENAKELVRFLSRFLAANINIIPVKRSICAMGWRGKDFLPYDSGIIFDGGEEYRRIFNALHSKGDFAPWRNLMEQWHTKSDEFRLYLDASFASVLLPCLNQQPFVVHLIGKSEAGKTVALYAALSAWGDPFSLCLKFDITKVALERYSGFFRHLPVGLNEAETATRKYPVQQMIYDFCEGRGKPRGNTNSGVEHIPEWQTICLTNGEDTLFHDNSKEGFLNRVIELPCKDQIFHDRQGAIDVIHCIQANYGHAGPRFVLGLQKELSQPEGQDKLKNLAQLIEKLCLEHGNITGKQASAASTLLVADILVQTYLFEREETEAIRNVTVYIPSFIRYLKQKSDLDLTGKAYDYIIGFVAQNRGNFITDENRYDSVPVCWGKILEGEVWIINNVFKSAMDAGGFPLSKVTRELAERGLLEKGMDGGNTITKYLNKAKPRCYVLKFPS